MALKQTAAESHERRERIVTAATDVFFRYGHARTTMGDIAEAARISRPVLYLVFPRKEDIFAAVIERLSTDTLAEYRAETAKYRSVGAKLHYCCERWAGHGYDLTSAHPDARDIFDLSFPPVRVMYDALETFLADLVREAAAKSRLEMTPEEIARALIFGIRGMKETAKSANHMRRLIAVQVDLVLAALKAR